MPVTAQRFIDAMAEAEAARSSAGLLPLFAPDAECVNLNNGIHRGHDGARDFWNAYFHLFEDLHSDYLAVIPHEHGFVLEWESSARLAGEAVRYRGVSLADVGTDGIRRFRAYYDTAPFLAHAHPRA